MVDPASGPFLFDTSAESWLARADDLGATDWMCAYLSRHEVHVSAVTVLERIRGYSLLWHIADRSRREQIESARIAYLRLLCQIIGNEALCQFVRGDGVQKIELVNSVKRLLYGDRIEQITLDKFYSSRSGRGCRIFAHQATNRGIAFAKLFDDLRPDPAGAACH